MVCLGNCECGATTHDATRCRVCEAMHRAGVPKEQAVQIALQMRNEVMERAARVQMEQISRICPKCGK